ncbi:hypothetical protein B0A48_18487 [Cryoendolithus antarcticus]|uniref:Solute carrier family 40 member n=1 Tax=Cryoendolithus antarcticus TaxID=1507870 RepID=A0A1V8S931_9PEZI|nr:hypothetical protein B0A48_18487 [Cryoendolithus antarcticus]
MARSASAILFATGIGWAIDHKARLEVVRFSIVAGRLAVILSAVAFWALWSRTSLPIRADRAIFSILILLSCVEKIASVTNLVSVERDWAVVVADGNEPGLQKLNARMRRIDLVCKLAGPLLIALIDGASTTVAIWLTLGLNVVSLPIEYYAINQVHRMNPKLGIPKPTPAARADSTTDVQERRRQCIGNVKEMYNSFRLYFRHPACLPSFALALLYLTVLSFGGQMVTYLLSAGFNSFHIALVRTLSVIIELSATWIAPRIMSWISPSRGAMWFLSWQILWLTATVSFFWIEPRAIVAASGLAAGTILSRVGLWGYDLCAQVIIQTEVEEDIRGSFSTTEAAFQNGFELLSYALTIALPRPDQFKYPTLVSVVAVFCSGGMYAYYLRKRRGHLVHLPFTKEAGHAS